MNSNKKRNIMISSIIAAMFIVPLIIFAIVYHSVERKNSFSPGSVDIMVHEGNGDEGEEVQKDDYEWDDTDGQWSDEKHVAIKDTRKYPGEVLRVCFVPMWFEKDSSDTVCGNVFSVGIPEMDAANNTLTYTDGDKTITLKLAEGWQSSGWRYSESGDGYFYYTGLLNDNDLTAPLLDRVVLNDKAYALTDTCDFRLDVLADAIQSSGSAGSTRDWDTPAP